MQAIVKWSDKMQFAGTGDGGHSVLLDGDNKTGNSPMELVLIALCGCTAFDVVSILQKKREPFTAVEVSAQAEKAPDPPRVFTDIRDKKQLDDPLKAALKNAVEEFAKDFAARKAAAR